MSHVRKAALPLLVVAMGAALAACSRNEQAADAATTPVAGLGAVAWVCAFHAVMLGGLLALADAVLGRQLPYTHGHPDLWAAAWVLVAAQLGRLLHRTGSFRWWTWVVFPVPLLFFDLVFLRSLVRTGVHRSVRWRGREVRL